VSRAVGALGLSRDARLRHASEIQAVFQQGRREERRAFVLLWVPRDGPARVGFAVSRQIRGAVRRNRARRRLRAAYRGLGPAKLRGVDAVFVARTWALEVPLDELRAEMSSAHAAASRNAGE
jgi:ribonuclease P protein component